ncbi:hypothetical protein niasHS_000077 [Heterodera schachtii]|uniref:Uncharacterized protein n=1 Tax=Heterodera schachtii TaxID=97005 RepID=A0ABD2KM47_HETSC
MSPTNALMAPPPTQALPPSSATIASPTTDRSDTWLSSWFNVGIIILLTCILIILVIVLCLQCCLFYRTRQQQFSPTNASPCQNSSAVSSPAASSPCTPCACVPLPIPTSVPMPSSLSADQSPPSPIPLQTFATSLQHHYQGGTITVPNFCSSSSDHSPTQMPTQTLAPSLRHYGQQFLPSSSMPYTADHRRPQVVVPCRSASPYADHREPSPIGRAVPFSSISDNPPLFSPSFGAHSMPWESYEYEYMYEYHLSEEYFQRK